jgi:MFS family permease
MSLSISFLSLGLFPLVIAPLSEMYGRKWVNLVPLYLVEADVNFEVLHIGNVLLGVSNLACAYAPNAGSLIAFRFLGWYFT